MEPDFDTMTEQDVRETIVRDLLNRLGYLHGSLTAKVRTEVTLKYDKAFLGRKKPSKDPPLTGRADYICDAISYGRWVVEVKSPASPITRDEIEQAHTYAAHPEVAATYFLMTNGRQFQLFATSSLDAPVMAWHHAETDAQLLALANIVGYDAFRRRATRDKPDGAKPLGAGLKSQLRIISGEVAFGAHTSDHPMFQSDPLNGMVGTITDGKVGRTEDGRLSATIFVRSAFQTLQELNRLAGFDNYSFLSADEYVSTDPEHPTVFQNIKSGHVAPGTQAKLHPNMPETPLRFGFDVTIFTQAIGYFDGDTFQGTVEFEYNYDLIPVPGLAAPAPPHATLIGSGTFKLNVAT